MDDLEKRGRTLTPARDAAVRFRIQPDTGWILNLGAAVKTGIRRARGEILIFMDADGQHGKGPADQLRVSPPIAQSSPGFRPYFAPIAPTDLSLGQSDGAQGAVCHQPLGFDVPWASMPSTPCNSCWGNRRWRLPPSPMDKHRSGLSKTWPQCACASIVAPSE